ncbi:hypothetical protein KO561_09490 [Radiobacillus kanasensis]|uniref:hypothetical protein n=1 Tax=Radiobacillus kanasensis TaxID=2844358 RepID=UPI001E4BE94A|nr:hypothetical protein [Radiobacillus kanasensis]UFU01144.1 hypothetical protein KO561_09490 [Radiobacillus kanasensis]
MAFGVKRPELNRWKEKVQAGEIAFLTHYWLDPRFPGCDTVTKVGCSNKEKLMEWGKEYHLDPKWIHNDPKHPHFDLFGDIQKRVLTEEKQWDQIERFNLILK